ncbi:MAG: dodecin domain-containing protein [Paracoccaceae bacterium]
MYVESITEIISSSSKSYEDSVRIGVARVSKTFKHIQGAWAQDQNVTFDMM